MDIGKLMLVLPILYAALAGPGSGRADGMISLVEYSTAHDYDCHIATANSFGTLELGLFDPVNPSFGMDGSVRAVSHVGGFRCRLEPDEGVFVLDVAFPAAVTEIGSGGDLTVTFAEPVPVVPGKTTLATVSLFFGGVASFELPETLTMPCYLGHNTGVRVVAPVFYGGGVSYIDADDPVDPVVTASVRDGRDFRFLLLQDPAVPAADQAWGRVKALYR